MRRIWMVVVAAGLAAGLFAGCNANPTPFAAKVRGTTIGRDAVTATMAGIARGKVSRCLFKGYRLEGAGSGTYSMAFASTVLTFMIERALASAEVDEAGLSVTPLARRAAAHLLGVALQGSAQACAPGTSDLIGALPGRFATVLTGYETAQAILAAHLAGTTLAPGSVAAFARAHPEAADVACVSQIVVSSAAAARSVIARAKAGMSFAALARTTSIDTATAGHGGALGCSAPIDLPSAYSGVVSELATGAVSAPIPLQSPYYAVVTVTSRRPGSALDAALGAITAGSAGLDSHLAALAGRGVSVAAPYGRWAKVSGTYAVVPPSAPADRFVPGLGALNASLKGA